MFTYLSTLFPPDIQTASPKSHRRRFGVIPAEPCRTSSMQTLPESPCAEKAVPDRFEH